MEGSGVFIEFLTNSQVVYVCVGVLACRLNYVYQKLSWYNVISICIKIPSRSIWFFFQMIILNPHPCHHFYGWELLENMVLVTTC